VVVARELSGRFGDRASRPPSADRAGDTADQRTDRTRDRADGRTSERSADSADALTDLVRHARIAVVLAERRVFRAFDSAVGRVVDVSVVHVHPPVMVIDL